MISPAIFPKQDVKMPAAFQAAGKEIIEIRN